ncbi:MULTISPECIES: M15 family metallopeptidase [unclassified Cellvibrio]|uniref:M15 family metallopeptidase n=1 Tax=unclassified Cellvibrio TaxID=2624793 RepID=UPI00124716DE|nr:MULTISPECIES: M15 family metallopeptidase [unclassified Cellvibrio]QEY16047.1 hypothetical protein D0C16_08670 [Cellvibrio sp. KY-GH-1]UUA74272.1 hypothetical protein NNX04_07475 [Cellvibrio sp. QJXJ]
MRKQIKFFACLIFIFFPHLASSQEEATPAAVTGTSVSGVGYVDVSSDATGINATIGRWDTPYPYGLNGPRVPGLEPNGPSIFYIDVDVNDGGRASFSYSYKTWDSGVYNWYDVYVETPTGVVNLVNKLGQPGSNYGTFFSSSEVALSVSLDEWRDQQVRFVFLVQQDGWGDQSQGAVIGFGLRSCTVAPLTPLTDAAALAFEGGQTVDTANLTAEMQTALSCVQTAVAEEGGTVRVNSAYRPPEYQNHLRAVWDKWNLLRNMREPECSDLRDEIQAEFQRHGLLLTQRPATGTGPHTEGRAIDMRSSLTTARFLEITGQCSLYRRLPVTDPVHFEHQ